MIFHIQKRERPFFQMDKAIVEDESLSFRAKGIMAYFLSRPNNWMVMLQDLINRSPKEGREAINSAIKELEQAKYAHLFRVQNSDGTLKGTQWVVYEQPTEIEKGEKVIKSDSPPRNGFTETRLSRNSDLPTVGKSATTNNNTVPIMTGTKNECTPVVPLVDFLEIWKLAGLKKIVAVEGKRLKAFRARSTEAFFQDHWRAGISKMQASKFCQGLNDRGWVADVDFFLRPGTLAKIIEGKYDDRDTLFADDYSMGAPRPKA